MKKGLPLLSVTEIFGAFARRDWDTVRVFVEQWNDHPHFAMSFERNTEMDLCDADPIFWLVFKLAVDTGKSPPDEREPPTLKRMRQSRQDCRAAVLALLSVVAGRRRPDLRRVVARDLWQAIARMVWAQRWEFYDGGVPNGD